MLESCLLLGELELSPTLLSWEGLREAAGEEAWLDMMGGRGGTRLGLYGHRRVNNRPIDETSDARRAFRSYQGGG